MTTKAIEEPVRRMEGKLVEWDDARGFGWVEAEGKRVFAHIKEFPRGQRRPAKGDELRFTPGVDPKGRGRAVDIRLAGKTASMRVSDFLLLPCLLMLPVLAGLTWTNKEWAIPGLMLAASVVSWMQYGFDKARAEAGMSRSSEAGLHVTELLGGWPGAYLAQRKFRHKTRKMSYQMVFWLIVGIWQLVALDFIMDHGLIKGVLGLIRAGWEVVVPSAE